MNWNNFTETVVGATVAGSVGGIAWLVRRVFTNQKQIELLSQEVKSREEHRQRDREDLQEVKASLVRLDEKIDKLKP